MIDERSLREVALLPKPDLRDSKSTIAISVSIDGHYLASTHGDHTVSAFTYFCLRRLSSRVRG